LFFFVFSEYLITIWSRSIFLLFNY
jgi:hypothetical protein